MVVQILDNNIHCNIWGQLLRVEFNLFFEIIAFVGATSLKCAFHLRSLLNYILLNELSRKVPNNTYSYSRYRKTPTKDCITNKTYFYVVYVRKLQHYRYVIGTCGPGTATKQVDSDPWHKYIATISISLASINKNRYI